MLDQATQSAYDARRDLAGKPFRAGCYAPWSSLYFNTNGDVVACCKNTRYVFGNVARERLDDIWRGPRVKALRAAMQKYAFGLGCEFCEWQIRGKQWSGLHAARYEDLPLPPAADEVGWPSSMEFAMSNTCNLACIMCYGVLSSTIRAHHLDLTAYHPLGTCRMGSDPRRSVIGPTQETWDVPGLFVCDGSAVPGPLGVNPQLTIMALSERAAAFVERRVEEGHAPRRVAPVGTVARFEETMSGMLQLEDGGVIDVSFTVKARGPASFATALREGGTFALTGTLDAEGLVWTLETRPV